MINQQLRVAVGATIAAFGLTILLAVADPEPARQRILAAREQPAARDARVRLADSAGEQGRTAGAPELSLDLAEAPNSPAIDLHRSTGMESPELALREAHRPPELDFEPKRSGGVLTLPTRSAGPGAADRHRGARADADAAPTPRREPPAGLQLGPIEESETSPPRVARNDSHGVSLDVPLPFEPAAPPAIDPLLPQLEVPVPVPDRRPVLFEPLDGSRPDGGVPAESSTSVKDAASQRKPLEVRLAGLERQIELLAQQKAGDDALRRATELLQQLEQRNRLQELEKKLEQLQSPGRSSVSQGTGGIAPGGAAAVQAEPGLLPPSPSPIALPAPAIAPGGGPAAAQPAKAPVLRIDRPSEGAERFSLQIADAPIGQVLEMLGELAGKNILSTPAVQGTVSANLIDVTVEEALGGILRARGFAHEQDERFIYVMTQSEFAARRAAERKLVTKVYRPHYISTFDLQALVLPLLTPEIGKLAVTNPNEIGVPSDNEQAGGDKLAQQDALLVQDYPEVIQTIDAVFEELDVPPAQIVIEAMILSVRLTDQMQFGVNFALLNGSSDNLVVAGNGNVLENGSGFPGGGNDSIIPPLGQFVANTAGLKYGFVTGDVTGFLSALENITDTNLIAAPQIRVLNKQRAQLIIGRRLSYTTSTFQANQTIENVNFLDAGTKLIIRPFIAPDGLIRMEIHPERSTATINPQTNLPDLDTTEVTTNVMVRDSTTVVIGGLIEETTVASYDQVPLLGSLPIAKHLFRNKNERIDRTELIVLITPRIVREPEAAEVGAAAAVENQHRHEQFTNSLSPINRQNLARLHYERAVHFFDCGELERAAQHVEWSLKLAPNNLQALRLQARIDEAQRARLRPWESRPEPGPPLPPHSGPSPQFGPPMSAPPRVPPLIAPPQPQQTRSTSAAVTPARARFSSHSRSR